MLSSADGIRMEVGPVSLDQVRHPGVFFPLDQVGHPGVFLEFYRFSCPFQVLTEPSFMPAVVVPGFDKNSLKDAPVKFSPGSAYQGGFVRERSPFLLFNSIDLLENQESLTVFYWRERATALQDGAHVVNLENK